MTSWHSYPKVWNLGHAGIKDLLLDDVIVEEKIDGSQFSFGMFNGELKVRSKGQEMILDAPEEMFQKAVDTVKALAPYLVDGWTYRGEYLQKPKHNVLAYDRTPEKNIILFDVNIGEEQYMPRKAKETVASHLGLECVPVLFEGKVSNAVELTQLLEKVSVLGGQKIEGFVIKNYFRFGLDKKALLGKYVSEAFKEIHKKDWKEGNPGQGDIVLLLANSFRTPARWNKAVQHVREQGLITDSPKDIGTIVKELQKDSKIELEQEVKDALFAWAWPQIQRRIVAGFPEFYKHELMAKQFEPTPTPVLDEKENDCNG